MISLIRHNVSLLFCLVGLIAGLVVAIYGGISFAGSLFVSLMIVGSAEPTAGFNLFPALLIIMQHAVTALAGSALAYFAGKGFIGRWRAGPPTEDSIVGQSPLARSAGLVLYGIAAFYGAYAIVFGMQPILEDYHLAINGDRTTARILGAEPAPEIHWDIQRLHYQFETRDGQIVDGYANDYSYPAQRLKDKGWAEVTYDPEKPAHSEINFQFSMQFVLYFFGSHLLILLVGIWGFAKNARTVTEAAPPVPPPGPVGPIRTSTALARRGMRSAPRTQFGRRGT